MSRCKVLNDFEYTVLKFRKLFFVIKCENAHDGREKKRNKKNIPFV